MRGFCAERVWRLRIACGPLPCPREPSHCPHQGRQPGAGLLARMQTSGPRPPPGLWLGGTLHFPTGAPGRNHTNHSPASLTPPGSPGSGSCLWGPRCSDGFWGIARKNTCKALSRTGAPQRPLPAGSLHSFTLPIFYVIPVSSAQVTTGTGRAREVYLGANTPPKRAIVLA